MSASSDPDAAPRHRTRSRRFLPERGELFARPGLRWLRPWMDKPILWDWAKGSVARGLALGWCIGLLIPIGRTALSILVAVLIRAHIPMAVAGTLITNPFTVAPIYLAAYQTGSLLLPAVPTADAATTTSSLGTLGLLSTQLLAGLLIFALAGSLLAVFGTYVLWGRIIPRSSPPDPDSLQAQQGTKVNPEKPQEKSGKD